jgi:hypothetical protein
MSAHNKTGKHQFLYPWYYDVDFTKYFSINLQSLQWSNMENKKCRIKEERSIFEILFERNGWKWISR